MVWICHWLIVYSLSTINNDTLKINLKQAKEMALNQNPTYQMAALSHTYDKLCLYENLSSNILDPTVSITYSGTSFGDQSYSSSKGYNFSLSLNQPVFDFGTTTSVLKSKFETSASGASKEEAKNLLYYQVEAQYLSVLKTGRSLELRNKAIKRAEENLRFVTKRVELGEASRLDLLNAKVYLNRSKLDLSSAHKGHQVAKRLLLNILGIQQQYELRLEPVKIDHDEFLLPCLDTLITESLAKRPRLKAAHEAIKEARLGFWGSFLSFLPQVSFKWLWSYNTEDFPDKLSIIKEEATRNTGWHGTVSIDLFSYPFEIWKMKTILNRSDLSLLNERLTVVKEVKDAWLDCVTADENLKLARSILEATKEGNTLAKTQYKLGLISTLDLFQAETDLMDAEVTYASALHDQYLVRTKLQYVIGEDL